MLGRYRVFLCNLFRKEEHDLKQISLKSNPVEAGFFCFQRKRKEVIKKTITFLEP